MQANEIGFFQLENLIKSRIPFSLLMIGFDLSQHYLALEKLHIQTHGIHLVDSDVENILNEFESKKIPTSQALVVMCIDGLKSAQLILGLEAKGYKNVFSVSGGLKQFLSEKGL